jgi:hypothetical protein
MHEHCHSGARTSSASPESRNPGQRSQWLNLCSWLPGPALTGRPGMTNEFFSTLLGAGRNLGFCLICSSELSAVIFSEHPVPAQ